MENTERKLQPNWHKNCDKSIVLPLWITEGLFFFHAHNKRVLNLKLALKWIDNIPIKQMLVGQIHSLHCSKSVLDILVAILFSQLP